MNRFAELLDRLAYEPGRNNKLRLVTALQANGLAGAMTGEG